MVFLVSQLKNLDTSSIVLTKGVLTSIRFNSSSMGNSSCLNTAFSLLATYSQELQYIMVSSPTSVVSINS